MIKILKNSGPWGGPSDNNSDDNIKKDPGLNDNQKTPNIDDFLRESKKVFNDIFNKQFNGGGNNFNKGRKKNILLPFFALFVIWLMTGIYKVNPEENALELYFGKYHSVKPPGLRYILPFPVGRVIKAKVEQINKEEFGYRTNEQKSFGVNRYANSVNYESESLMLTGDENIIDVEFETQWKIEDIKNYVFNVRDPEQTIRKASESAMREVIGRNPIGDALSDKKRELALEVKNVLQTILDSYDSGIKITLVQLLRADPPAKVIDSFRDVQVAKADKERKINEAEAYKNDVIPKAEGRALKIIQEAEAYKEKVMADAQGQADRFLKVYNQYKSAKFVTKKRIYLETMEKIYKNSDKVILDKNTAKSVLPYLSVDKINNRVQ